MPRLNKHDFGFTETKYSHFLRFKVHLRTNKFVYSQTDKYTPTQQELHDKIKSLHDSGLGYRRIAKYLNDKGITTFKGHSWGCNYVYSVLKKYRLRLKRLKYINQEYEPVWSKMEIKWEKNQ